MTNIDTNQVGGYISKKDLHAKLKAILEEKCACSWLGTKDSSFTKHSEYECSDDKVSLLKAKI